MRIFYKIYQKVFPKKFHIYYQKIKDNKNLDEDLKFISDVFIKSESYKTVSNQWHLLNIIDYKNIIEFGLKNVGTKTFGHYFNFYNYDSEHIKNLFSEIETDKVFELKSNIFKINKDLNLKTTLNYNFLLLLLYFNLKKSEYFRYLKLLNDNTYLDFGEHFLTIENNNITSEKIISLFDLEKIEQFSSIEDNIILEIGAGSGRLSECILTLRNVSKYVICDIPPAIFISYKRLKKAFPNKKIKLLIDINNANELKKKILENDVTFIIPHQISYFEKKLFDLVLAIDCMHEMDKSTLNFYFEHINNISKKFYFSIWKKTKNWATQKLFKKTERLDFEKGDYPIPKKWKIMMKKNLKFPSNQICIGFKLDE